MGRMIYTRIVIDMQTGQTLEQEGFWHEGTLAECKGGGSSVDSVDEAYNDRMATISEEQQAWARNYYAMWEKDFKPYEIAQAQTNFVNLPLENNVYRSQLEAVRDLLPQEKELYKQQMTAKQDFMHVAAKGVDVNERMGLAKADVASAWKNTNETTARANARIGVNPNSGRYQGVQAALQTQQAAQLAQASTTARVNADQENFDRLTKAASLGGGSPTNSLFQGLGFLGGK